MKKLVFFSLISFNILAQTPGAGVTDIDGNQYSTVIIGAQEWLAENLRTTKYSNGDDIPNVSGIQWGGLTMGAWVYYNNDSQYDNPYGKLYNWLSVDDSRGLCPIGWHVPTDSEWSALINTIDPFADGGNNLNVAGGKMKTVGTLEWMSPNTGATNESLFSGLPGGCRTTENNFNYLGLEGYFWTSTESSSNFAWRRDLVYYTGVVDRWSFNKKMGVSVRCLKGSLPLETIELLPVEKELLRITDLMGRETEFTPNTVLIYVYSDGTTERVLQIEQ
jgi:uncharacterized protein (TIGR02145 family)